jgi:hypothetical protein
MKLFITGILALALSCGFVGWQVKETVVRAQCTVLTAMLGGK